MNNFTKSVKIFIDNDQTVNKSFNALLENLNKPPAHNPNQKVSIVMDWIKTKAVEVKRPWIAMPFSDLLNNAIAEIEYRELAVHYLMEYDLQHE